MYNQSVLEKCFEDAERKISHAIRHVQEISLLQEAYISNNSVGLVEQRDKNSGAQVFVIEAEPAPIDMALATGDAFHNLSAAMDYIATGVLRAAGHEGRRRYFPSAKGLSDLKVSEDYKYLSTHTPEFAHLVYDKFMPIKGGELHLWEIRRADNFDKHKLIVPTIAATEVIDVILTDNKNGIRLTGRNFQVNAGGVMDLAAFNIPGGRMTIERVGGVRVCLRFPSDFDYFAGEIVIDAIQKCARNVRDVMKQTSQHLCGS